MSELLFILTTILFTRSLHPIPRSPRNSRKPAAPPPPHESASVPQPFLNILLLLLWDHASENPFPLPAPPLMFRGASLAGWAPGGVGGQPVSISSSLLTSDLQPVKSSSIQKLRGYKRSFNEFSGEGEEGGEKRPHGLRRARVSGKLLQKLAAPWSTNVYVGSTGRVCRQSHLCSAGGTAGGGQGGSWQTGSGGTELLRLAGRLICGSFLLGHGGPASSLNRRLIKPRLPLRGGEEL